MGLLASIVIKSIIIIINYSLAYMPARARTIGRERVQSALLSLFHSLEPLACLITSSCQLCSRLWLAAACALSLAGC